MAVYLLTVAIAFGQLGRAASNIPTSTVDHLKGQSIIRNPLPGLFPVDFGLKTVSTSGSITIWTAEATLQDRTTTATVMDAGSFMDFGTNIRVSRMTETWKANCRIGSDVLRSCVTQRSTSIDGQPAETAVGYWSKTAALTRMAAVGTVLTPLPLESGPTRPRTSDLQPAGSTGKFR
jgi:hypothetical protein